MMFEIADSDTLKKLLEIVYDKGYDCGLECLSYNPDKAIKEAFDEMIARSKK